jgi:HK97 family phage major capsid protein
MDEKTLELLETKFTSAVDKVFEQKLKEVVGPFVAEETKKIVSQMRLERALYGNDKSGLSDEQKIQFAQNVKDIIIGRKAPLIESENPLGGYLVPTEVYAGIQRVAASVGLVLNQATKFDLKTDELEVPRYTGAFLEGGYYGEDTEAQETSISFGDARLIVKTWNTIFRVSNALLADASVNLADWLIGIIAEGLANRIDKEAFKGNGSPFVGILNDDNVTTVTLASGKTNFNQIDLDDCSNLIAQLEESILPNAAFYMHRTLWHSIRTRKDTAGNYIIGFQSPIVSYEKAQGINPAGYIWGYPVYTTRHLPALSDSAASTKFLVFGNLKAGVFYGDRGQLAIAKSDSATVGGKNVFAANQTALRGTHRHALSVGLYQALVVARTAAS